MACKARGGVIATGSIILTMIGAGCDLMAPRDPLFRLLIETDRAEYLLGRDSVVSVELLNESTHPVYLLGPELATIQMQRDGVWYELGPWYGFVAGGRWTATVHPGEALPWPYDFHLGRVERDERPGTFRFMYRAYQDPDFDILLPLASRLSNEFAVASRSSEREPTTAPTGYRP